MVRHRQAVFQPLAVEMAGHEGRYLCALLPANIEVRRTMEMNGLGFVIGVITCGVFVFLYLWTMKEKPKGCGHPLHGRVAACVSPDCPLRRQRP